jgi:hypothetical protein
LVSIVKTTPVIVYLGEELIGSGELAYDDRSAHALTPYTVRHCDETPVYIGSNVVPLYFCWDDTVTSWATGTVKRTMDIPVYIGDSEVGRASIEVEDSFGMVTFTPIITLLIPLIMLIIVVAVVAKPLTARKREERIKA